METEINLKIKQWFNNFDNLVNLFSSASYNSYWFLFGAKKGTYNKYLTKEQRENLECREEKWAQVLLNGGEICVEDLSDEEETIYTINLQKIIIGATTLLKEHPQVIARIFTETEDFYDTDAVIQYAIFGEWVYG